MIAVGNSRRRMRCRRTMTNLQSPLLLLLLAASVIAFDPPKQPAAMPCKFAAKGGCITCVYMRHRTTLMNSS